jgi:hypothetical protein
MEFARDHLSQPLRSGDRLVYEVAMGTQRSGWIIAPADWDATMVLEAMNAEASRRSFGVFCADLMRGLTIASAVR